MHLPSHFRPRCTLATLSFLALASSGALAHPGHDEAGTFPDPPAFFLAQAGPPPGATPQPRDSATAPRNSVSITVEGEYRLIKSNGWPDHAPGEFPRRGNPNSAAPQTYNFRVPLKPAPAATPMRGGGWWWGIAVNGVPFEPGTAETWNNDRQSGWRYEAATGFLNLGLDEHNAHVQPNGSYHYHGLPTGLVERLGGDGKKMLLIGWAADGYPLYTSWAYSDAKDAKSPLRKMKPGYRLKQGARPAQVNGPGGNYDGRFTEDFEFAKGAGDLDEFNGRTGVTPEYPEGTYYYCVTSEFPFLPRSWHGTPDPSFSKGGPPPGAGGPGGGRPLGGAPNGILEGGTGGPGGPGGPGRFGGPNLPVLKALDLNSDGVLDAAEISKAATSLKTLDRDHSGTLTPNEYRPGPPSGVPALNNEPPAPKPFQPPTPAPVAPPNGGRAQSGTPNVLILVADDLGWGDVGFHQGAAATPNLNRLVKEGVELQRFYVYPVCSPTRAALLTGQMPRRFGVTTVMGPGQTIPAGITTLPGTFRAAGYTTSLIGKWHLGVGRGSVPMEHGFEHFYGFLGPEIDYYQHTNQRGAVDWQRDGVTVNETGYSTVLFASEAIRQIQQRDAKRPFFIEVTFNAPHVPKSAPPELVAKYQSLGALATNAAVIEALDTGIGRVLAALDDQKLRENTLVVFFSDNGASRREGSNGPLRAGKDTLFEGGIRTPCVLRWPGQLPAGTATQLPVAAQDLFPTLAAATGVACEAKLDGVNLWAALQEGRVVERPSFAVATADIAIVDGEWKLIATVDGHRSLYHVSGDQSESTDEAATHPEIAERLGAKAAEFQRTLPAAAAQRPRPGPR